MLQFHTTRREGFGTTHLVGKARDEEVEAEDKGTGGDDVEVGETKASAGGDKGDGAATCTGDEDEGVAAR